MVRKLTTGASARHVDFERDKEAAKTKERKLIDWRQKASGDLQ